MQKNKNNFKKLQTIFTNKEQLLNFNIEFPLVRILLAHSEATLEIYKESSIASSKAYSFLEFQALKLEDKITSQYDIPAEEHDTYSEVINLLNGLATVAMHIYGSRNELTEMGMNDVFLIVNATTVGMAEYLKDAVQNTTMKEVIKDYGKIIKTAVEAYIGAELIEKNPLVKHGMVICNDITALFTDYIEEMQRLQQEAKSESN